MTSILSCYILYISDWEQVPIGTCPNVEITATNLELPLYLDKLQKDTGVPQIINFHQQEYEHYEFREVMDDESHEILRFVTSFGNYLQQSTPKYVFLLNIDTFHEFHEICHSVTFYFMKKDSKRCCDICCDFWL